MAGAGERRIVSVLVADLADSTSIAERLGAERYKFLLDELIALMREEVERFGGTVAQLTGDGVLALFGAPVAHEDDSERAVRAALAIRTALRRYAAEIAPAYGIDLGARVAVNTGPVVIPAGDAPPHALYNALGDTVNVAARLQALGDVVVGPVTARQVEGMFELAELGELELKGKSVPVAAFRVTRARDEAVSHPQPQLVGRRRELAELTEALEGLFEGRGAIVSITGEPGIGKSRLAAEGEERVGDRICFLVGHAVPYAETSPYWPVRDLLRDWLGLGVSDTEARVRLELRTALARTLDGAADEAYPFIATVLGLALEPAQAQRLRDFARDAVQRQIFDWLFLLVREIARERPLCLVFEDLHWSDEATLALLGELLPAVEQAAVCFVLIHRSDPDHPAWQLVDRARRRFRDMFRELALEPLTDADGRVLAETEAGGELPEELAQLLTERAGGNPYFVGEAVRDLRERGVLEGTDGSLVLTGEVSVPGAIQEALQARLDRLDGDARELITTASVIGRSFGLPLLERVLPRTRLVPTLSDLVWLQLVVEERGGAAPEYRFRHGLVQEVAYGTLLDSRRRELHLQVAEALLELYSDSPAEVYGLLALHFAAADEPERAGEYLLKAGDAARAVYADEEAIELYGRALAFMERTGDEVRARETLLRIGLMHHLTFDFRAANEAFGEAFALPMPAPTQLDPDERLAQAMGTGWGAVAPGHGYARPGWEIGMNLFRGLFEIGRDLDVNPDLAERFTVSDDGCLYRFTLRSDASWSDGTPVTADDFESTFGRMVEDDVPTAFWLDGIRATALDRRTLEIRLSEPRAHFLYMLGVLPLFAWPRHVREREGPGWHLTLPLVGNGPYVLTTHDDDRRLELEAAPGWYGARGNVGKVMIELDATGSDARERWGRAEFDVLDFTLASHVAVDESVVVSCPAMSTSFLGFHPQRAPFDDARVRRAFAHAIDRQRFARAFGGTAAPTGGLIPPSMPGHSHAVAPAFDPDRARALLREAGYPDGRALGEIVLAGLDLANFPASQIAAQLDAIGIDVRLLPTSSDLEQSDAMRDHAHVFMHGWSADYPDPGGGFLESLLHGAPLYLDEGLEELLAAAASLRDRDERLRAYRQFERIWIGEQVAVVPLTYDDVVFWCRPWVTGMWVNPIVGATFAEAVVHRTAGSAARGDAIGFGP